MHFWKCSMEKPPSATIILAFAWVSFYEQHFLYPFLLLSFKLPVLLSRENLYNTNRDFDWGSLRLLAEDLTLARTPPTLFFLVFTQPGVYAFKLSDHQYKHMVLPCLFVQGLRGSYLMNKMGERCNRSIVMPCSSSFKKIVLWSNFKLIKVKSINFPNI